RAVERVAEADHAVRVVGARGVVAGAFGAVAPGAAVARLVAFRHRRFAHRVEFGLRFVGVVGLALGDQALGGLAVAVQALGLVDRALVVVQAQPGHGVEDRVDRGLGAALAIGILDPQDELAAAMARLQPAIQRGTRAADVQVAGGTGGEAGAAGHGGLWIRVSIILAKAGCRRPWAVS